MLFFFAHHETKEKLRLTVTPNLLLVVWIITEIANDLPGHRFGSHHCSRTSVTRKNSTNQIALAALQAMMTRRNNHTQPTLFVGEGKVVRELWLSPSVARNPVFPLTIGPQLRTQGPQDEMSQKTKSNTEVEVTC